jgi:hypothetical protein
MSREITVITKTDWSDRPIVRAGVWGGKEGVKRAIAKQSLGPEKECKETFLNILLCKKINGKVLEDAFELG